MTASQDQGQQEAGGPGPDVWLDMSRYPDTDPDTVLSPDDHTLLSTSLAVDDTELPDSVWEHMLAVVVGDADTDDGDGTSDADGADGTDDPAVDAVAWSDDPAADPAAPDHAGGDPVHDPGLHDPGLHGDGSEHGDHGGWDGGWV